MVVVACTRDVTKETVTALADAPRPPAGRVVQLRTGKVRAKAMAGEIDSAIFKQALQGPVECTATGLLGDEHHAGMHGGTERAVHQYDPDHYAAWQVESCPEPALYEPGAFGENLVGTGMSEDNVCIGDVFRVGGTVLLEVSEPRHPCHKLNARFCWPRALGRTIRTARSGWNMRVLQPGPVCAGDAIALVRRPFPQWSVLNVQRVIRGRDVGLDLLAACVQLPMTALFRDMAADRLRRAPKTYTLVAARLASPRVRELTFALKDGALSLPSPAFEAYSYAQITFGPPGALFSRCYSIVDGDIYRFTLGVALDRQSRGGSAYLHQELNIGDEIDMAPGTNPSAIESDARCAGQVLERIVIAGGIGITAFLPSVRDWEAKGLSYRIHYAVHETRDAAFLEQLPRGRVTLYASSEGHRLDLASVIPDSCSDGGGALPRVFCCGPSRMMDTCARITTERGYPEHMVHFEDFGGGGSGGGELGAAFKVQVNEPETGRNEDLAVPANKTLLDVLLGAGFDIDFSCKIGGCGACKVKVCEGDVSYKSTALLSKDKGSALQACVDRGHGNLKLEID
ncbi:pyruvate kinase-like protein [Microdochium bolleyi]|uniref:Pyruvate kinase-like protein n=1 Tax=Microdochium bolleyi TaxID=196109 RepID=A0A136IR47_9PEZI|nr:pyruvate kinase-like protein [Microdochium bolleyi]